MKQIFKYLSLILVLTLLCSAATFADVLSEEPVESGEELLLDSDNVELNVSSQGPYNLSHLIEEVETASYYEGYDNETLKWMKSLGEKSVFFSRDNIVIMDSHGASKIHSEYATDVEITEFFECTVLENHSLGNVKYSKDVLLVENVNYLYQNISYFDV